jgi:hypothetical protein
MRHRQLFVSIFLLLVATLAGCDPADSVVTPGQTGDGTTAQDLTVIAMGGDMVKLSWRAPTVNTPYMFKIRWRRFGATEDEGEMFEGDHELKRESYGALVVRLKPEMYRFTVEVVQAGSYATLPGVDVYGAPAKRYTDDAARPGERLRLYEPASDKGNGLVIALGNGGATRVVPAEAQPGTLQFIFLLEGESLGDDRMRFSVAGVGEANIPEEIYDPTAWIRGVGCPVCELDLMEFSYEDYLAEHHPDQKSHHDIYRRYENHARQSRYVQGAVIGAGDRTGMNYRVARIVFYQSPDGKLLHGEAPNRFVEIQLSVGYRGVPFA